MLQKPSLWNVSPAAIAPNARSLWKGLAFIAPLWGGAGRGAFLGADGRPLAGANLVAGATLQWRGTPYGIGVGISGASDLLTQNDFDPLVTANGAGGGDFTVICLANPVAEAAMSAGISVEASAVNTTRLHLGFNCNDNTTAVSGQFAFVTRQAGASTAALVAGGIDGNYHLFAGRRSGTEHTAWIDGIIRAALSGTVRDFLAPGAGMAIGCRAETAGFRINTATTIVLAAAWNRALSDAEMRMLARDAFCMFRPAPEWRGVWTPLAGGGDVVLNPADLTETLGYETPGFSQAHYLSMAQLAFAIACETPGFSQIQYLTAAKALITESYETPGLSQTHLVFAQRLNSILLFENAGLAMSAAAAPGFRWREIGNNGRRTDIPAAARSGPSARDGRSRSIME